MPELQITVTSGQDRLSQREQIEQVLTRAQAKEEPFRIRLPLTIYDHADYSRSYLFVRDATWNLALPSAQITPETVEQLITTIGKCLVAIAQHGSEEVEESLRNLGDSV